jgi:proteasome alpha subunit
MAFQPYVPPEQLMKDRAEYARKGIGLGKSVVALEYAEGILFLAENPSATLYKISEIYDRIAFAGVGKYSEFDSLRIAGIQLADLRGYAYDREDVNAKTVANAYSQALSAIFTQQMKPYEVELLVGQVGDTPADNELFHVLFDGSVTDEHGWVAIGGRADEVARQVEERYREDLSLAEAVGAATSALGSIDGAELPAEKVEACILERGRPRRKFRRLADAEVSSLLTP